MEPLYLEQTFYMEHLLEQAVEVGHSEHGSQREGRESNSKCSPCLRSFEEQTTAHSHSDRHPFPAFGKDFHTVLNLLNEEKVFNKTSGRTYPLYKGTLEMHTFGEMKKKVESNIKGLL